MVIAAAGAVLLTAPAQAGSQSSSTSSNSSANNGVLRDRVVDTYCEDRYCERSVSRRTYRDDDRWVYRDGKRYGKVTSNDDDYRRYDDRYEVRRRSGRDDENDDDWARNIQIK